MKVLLANPATRQSMSETEEKYYIKAGSRWPWSYAKKKGRKNTACFFPFFLAYTASVLMNRNHDVHVIDGVAMDLQEDEFLERAGKIKPGLIVVETATHAINQDLALCGKLKGLLPDTRILLCGAHATACGGTLLEENVQIDYVALGEYEYTVLGLVEALESGEKETSVPGLAYRAEGEVFLPSKRGFVDDINSLPYPAFDLFPSSECPDLTVYGDGVCTYKPAVTLQSSRGCPFKCDFCLWNQVMYGEGPYRTFDPCRVVDEMEYVIERFGAREIYFDDDDFCIRKKHVLGICDEIRRRNLRIKWSCMGDAISVDEEMMRGMADSGCIFMKFGVESGNREILKNIGKPLNPDKAVQVAEWGRKYGIMIHATFSLGLDGETRQTMEDTLRLANRIKFDTAQVSIATPLPGTRFYRKLMERGFIVENKWESFDGTTTCVFGTDGLTGAEIEEFRRRAIRSMILHKVIDPAWIVRFAKRNYLLCTNYGIKSVLEPIRALIGL
ncbi:MAG: radical SAM protein [Actinomycetota bacterium]|nr:radical SAM protein [Actinomycetota bacterium]